MKTVQVAIRDSEFARSISSVLRHGGKRAVLVVDQPDLSMEGVIVLDCEHLERAGIAAEQADRLVLVTGKDPDRLARIWNAGIRHVVFEDDAPNTVRLAVSAAELRQLRPPVAGKESAEQRRSFPV
jgi:phosphopantothenate synthetase